MYGEAEDEVSMLKDEVFKLEAEIEEIYGKISAYKDVAKYYDRELLAMYSTIKHFRHLLEAREFDLLTDHKPLTYAFRQEPEKATSRQFRQLDFISLFTTSVIHIKGKENIS